MKLHAYALIIGGFCGFFFVAFNVYVSQNTDRLFLKATTNPGIESAQELLDSLDHTPFFTSQLAYFNERFGPEIQNKLVTGENLKEERIKSLLDLLSKNPKSTTVLLKLAIISFDEGENEKAINYYNEAKKVDPWIKITPLETLVAKTLNSD